MKATTLILAAAAALMANITLAAETLPLQSVNKANEVIDAAIEAHGGKEALDGLRTLAQKQEFLNIATGQSRKPGPPYDRSRTATFNAIDLENEIFVNRNRGEGGGYVFAPSNHFMQDVPLENFYAVYETARAYRGLAGGKAEP